MPNKFLFLFAIFTAAIIPAPAQVPDLFTAAKTNNVTLAATLLRSGANVNQQDSKGYTPLIYATYDGSYQVAEFLLNHGADTEAKDRSGRTALMGACFKGEEQEVKLLIDHGARINAKDSKGITSVMYAMMSGHFAIVQELRTGNAAKSTGSH